MTTVLDRPPERMAEPRLSPVAPPPAPSFDPRRVAALSVMWVLALAVGMALVMYGFGPFFEQRDQRHLMNAFRADARRAANEASGLAGVTVATKAPEPGTPVASLEIGDIRLQQAVVEGVDATHTRLGPGHVPGTSGLGQPGNSVVVGRRAAFGGPFSDVGDLRVGAQILVTTTQGQSVYAVTSTRRVRLRVATGPGVSTMDSVYGPSKNDRLTLVTSASASPANHARALVVVAEMKSTPFAPTPQGGRHDSDVGTGGEKGAVPAVVIALLVYGIAMGASIMLYRRLRTRTAYILTIAPVLALTIVGAETLSRLLPAWL